MNCEKCNSPLLMNGVCSKCGVKNSFYIKCKNTSNWYYNKGLDKAIIRDLSGAKEDLKKALKYNKMNIDARNLLGLIYNEMGESVAALTQWIISQNFQEKNNLAQKYIEMIQDNPTRIDQVNQTVKKYNQTLTYLHQGDDDLALIQLKRVLNLTPNHVNGYLLLALLHIKNDNYEKAKKALKRVLKIDHNNTLALKYYSEIAPVSEVYGKNRVEGSGAKEIKDKEIRKVSADTPIDPMKNRKVKMKEIQPTNQLSVDQYVENTSNRYTVIGIVVGIIVAIVVMWALIIPQKTMSMQNEYKNLKSDYSDQLSSKTKQINSLQQEKKDLQDEINGLNKKVDSLIGDTKDGNIFDNLMAAAKLYMEGNQSDAAEKLLKIDASKLKSTDSKNLYKKLSGDVLAKESEKAYQDGYGKYSIGNYSEAIKLLKDAIKMDDENVDAYYYLARSYEKLGDKKKAISAYKDVTEKFSDNSYASRAQNHIDILEGKKEDTSSSGATTEADPEQ